eukprot:9416703-Alexandrium_andersonii.AAC.1
MRRSAGCTRCVRVGAGLVFRGIKHRDARREGIEARLREESDPRIATPDERFAECVIAAGGDPS